MAKQKNDTAKDQDGDKKVLSPNEILKAAMGGANKEWHLNHVKEIYYRVSTGSLMWDVYTDGGLPPGLHRLIGPPESGKSSSALEICRNFLKLHKNGRGFYIKAEGRLSKEMQARTGLKFVYTVDEWVDGTIFVLESNYYEFIINTLRAIIKNPGDTTVYCVIIDSIDALILQNDAKKEFGKDHKVAGAPLLTKQFMQSMANEMTKRGHICLMTSQYSTNIQIDTYAAATDKRSRQGGGGWAAAHFANFAFDFGDTNNGDQILENEDAKPGPTNRILGKRVKVRFKKSTNEKTGMEISYPVKYNVTGKSSVWPEIEILDILKMFSKIKIAASSELDAALSKEIATATGLEVPEKFRGQKRFLNWLEANPTVTEFLNKKFRETLLSMPAPDSEEEEESNEAEKAKV